MTLVTTQERDAVRCYFSNRYWKNTVNDNDLVLQEELQRESQLSCGYWWTGVAWGDRWKCFPQYRWPKFRASRQGMSLIGCSYWSSCSFICHFSSDHTFVVVWLHPWMLSQGQRWNNIHSLSLFLSVCAPFQNTFVGLTNLGATCYVNTFLQVWFHNLELRRSLYQCHNSRAQEHNIESGITETKYWRCFFMFVVFLVYFSIC